MNVLAALRQYVPHSRVGAWITTHEYLAGMAARGHDVTVVELTSDRPEYDIDGVRVIPRGTPVGKPDVVVSHLGDHPHVSHLAEHFGVASVRMVHGYLPDSLERLTQFRTDLAVFASQALADDCGWDGPGIIAHPPVYADDYLVRPGSRITLSNLRVEKGGLLLDRLATALPDLEFLAVRGYGEQYPQQSRNVRVIDPVEDMRDVYRQTRILLMPSDRESYGRVAVEAALSGIPTIAHPSPGLVEAMGDHAIWVDRTDRNGWVNAIRRLQDPRAWKVASANARAVVTDPDATVDRVCRTIASIVDFATH